MANVFKEDDGAFLCFQSSSAVASHNWVSKNLSHLYPSSAVRNSIVKWSDWIDKLLGGMEVIGKRLGKMTSSFCLRNL
ncbi:unnamed protein product [Prunus armeniaca]